MLVCTSACAPVEVVPPPPPPPADSLLFHVPLIGDETEPRGNHPEPGHVLLGEISVDCWKTPPEARLRFPVELREGARFSFKLGAITRVPIRIGDLTMRVEYLPDDPHPGRSSTGDADTLQPAVLFQTTPVDTPQCFEAWYHVDVSLETFAPGRGELRFLTEGPLSGDPGLDILWGQPTIYYPDEMRQKNILLIGVDTLRRDALTPYGAPENVTPNLEAMTEFATTFNQARSQAPWTLPSFASMVTGRVPSEIGATIYTGVLPERANLISEVLLPEGYATATICSNTWLGNEQSGFHQGVEELWFRVEGLADVSVEQAKDFIARSIDRDWFCFLHFIDPHAPYLPPAEFAELTVDPFYNGVYKESFGQIELWKSGDYMPPDEDIQHIFNLQRAEVSHVDSALGNLFAFLEENGELEDTLIIFAADHGEEFFEHGGFEHGHSQYDELVHMPLIVRGDGFPEGERIDTCVGNFDIFPTILTWLGMELPDDLDGVPLQDVIAGDVGNDRIIFGEDNTRGTLRKFCVQWPYKCILDYVTGDRMLFNLEDDPGETIDISGDDPELTRELTAAIVQAMVPDQTGFHIWITRGYSEGPHMFTGTLTVPGGIKKVYDFKLTDSDTYIVEGDTITFTIISATVGMGSNKHLLILPEEGADTIDATIFVDGRIQNDRFYPYGSRMPEPSGSAVVSINDFPLGPSLPLSIEEYPAGCYIWGVRGYDREENRVELDEETQEQLRALGYVN